MGAAAKHAEKTKDREKAKRLEKLFENAMDYAEKLIENTMNPQLDNASMQDVDILISHDDAEEEDMSGNLTNAGKAEVAMVVLLYFHMVCSFLRVRCNAKQVANSPMSPLYSCCIQNRIISAVLGEQMSAAMFCVPETAAKRMESRSVMGVVNKLMAPVLAGGMKAKHKPGITASLFPEGSSCLEFMPEHLTGAALAGEERAIALSRLVAWSMIYEQRLIQDGIVSQDIIDILDDPNNRPPPRMRTHQIAHWATVEMRGIINTLPDKASQVVANVLLFVSYTPQSVFNSIHWKEILQALGGSTSKTLVIWWSLRLTFKKAKGLSLPRDDSNSGSGW